MFVFNKNVKKNVYMNVFNIIIHIHIEGGYTVYLNN